MREKLQTLPLAELKEMARNQGIKGISSLRKAEIIDLLCAAAEKNPEVKPTEIRKEEKRRAQAQDSAQPRQETVKPRQDNTQSRPRSPRTDRKAAARSQGVTPTGLTIINIQLPNPSRTGRIPVTARTRVLTSSPRAANARPGPMPGPIQRACPTRIWQSWTAGLKPMGSWR